MVVQLIHNALDLCVISVVESSVNRKNLKFTSNGCTAVMTLGFGWPRNCFYKYLHFLTDMAEVLRDFQCKLCSKLLGSRAALQRHSKEVHSRNSAVVSCPRCQKLFQNRSNLKIHMWDLMMVKFFFIGLILSFFLRLTHSGVRPFK